MALLAYAKDECAVLDDAPCNIKWQTVVPIYTKPKAVCHKYKTTIQKSGSFEDIMDNLVQSWGNGCANKTALHPCQTVDLDNCRPRCHGQKKQTVVPVVKKGICNVLLDDTVYYDCVSPSSEDSHRGCKKTSGNGCACDVIEVCSTPSNLTPPCRPLGKVAEEFACMDLCAVPCKVKPANRKLELIGMRKTVVDEKLKIQDLQVFCNPKNLFTQLVEGFPHGPIVSFQSKTSALPDQLSEVSVAGRRTESSRSSQAGRPCPQIEPFHQASQGFHTSRRSEGRKHSSSSAASNIVQTLDQWQSAQPYESYQEPASSHTYAATQQYPPIQSHQARRSSHAFGASQQYLPTQPQQQQQQQSFYEPAATQQYPPMEPPPPPPQQQQSFYEPAATQQFPPIQPHQQQQSFQGRRATQQYPTMQPQQQQQSFQGRLATQQYPPMQPQQQQQSFQGRLATQQYPPMQPQQQQQQSFQGPLATQQYPPMQPQPQQQQSFQGYIPTQPLQGQQSSYLAAATQQYPAAQSYQQGQATEAVLAPHRNPTVQQKQHRGRQQIPKSASLLHCAAFNFFPASKPSAPCKPHARGHSAGKADEYEQVVIYQRRLHHSSSAKDSSRRRHC